MSESNVRQRGNPGKPIYDWDSIDWASPEYPGDRNVAKVVGCSVSTVRYHRLRAIAKAA